MAKACVTVLALLTLTVPLYAENGSAQTGSAVLASSGDQTRVQIMVRREPAGAVQPATIRIGPCGSVESIVYVLDDVRDGRSMTVLPIPLARLTSRRFVLNVEESPRSLRAAKDARDVSCGRIP